MKHYFPERLWLVFAILATLCWGVWGILAKFISSDISPYVNHLLFTIGMLFTIPFVVRKCKLKDIHLKGIIWGIVAGILAVIGNIAVYQSFGTGGLAAVVIPVTNLYPLALVFWGLFSAAQKVTTNYISAEWSYISFIVSSVLITIGFFVFGLIDFNFTSQTLWVGSLAGMLNGLGVLASFAAYSAEGKASKVTAITGALQPVFTIILALTFLKEKLGPIELGGIPLAIVGSLLLSVEKKR